LGVIEEVSYQSQGEYYDCYAVDATKSMVQVVSELSGTRLGGQGVDRRNEAGRRPDIFFMMLQSYWEMEKKSYPIRPLRMVAIS
jgi:hypothetical protein